MPTGRKKASPARAQLKEPLACDTGGGSGIAPAGDYRIECCDGRMGLRHCASENLFTLSFDAWLQHLIEGRVTLSRD